MASEYKQFTNEGFDVEGSGYDNRPSYDESNAGPSSVPPQKPYLPPNSSEYPMQQPSKSQQAAPLPQQQPDTDDPQPQVVQVQQPIQQNIVNVSTETMPNDYSWLALFVAIFCCLPIGIVALMKSNEVRNRSAAGDYHGAALSSFEAKRWSSYGLQFGSLLIGGFVLGGIVYAVLHYKLHYGY